MHYTFVIAYINSSKTKRNPVVLIVSIGAVIFRTNASLLRSAFNHSQSWPWLSIDLFNQTTANQLFDSVLCCSTQFLTTQSNKVE